MGPVTSNHMFGIRTDVLLQLLRIYARNTYPGAEERNINELVPLLLQQLTQMVSAGNLTV